MESKVILSFIACILIILIYGKSFYLPIKRVVKLVANSVLGAFIIFVINLVGTSFDFHIGLNIFNAIVVGILGIPGAILLIILKIFCGIWK